MFYIGNVCVKNRVGLAPMAGISNAAYIKLVSEMGLGFAVTELISSEAIFRGNKKTIDMLNGISDLDIPVGVQIFGGNPDSMAKAAKFICDNYHVSFIDINMGCPVPKVAVRSQAGSSLLKNPSLAYDIVKSVVDSVNVPVTVKIRSGWDSNSINALEIAKLVEKAGASMITVHPRTRAQGYSGQADWSIIKSVKENVSIPVIGNGDIKSYLDAKRMLDETLCDGIMIGRAAIGNPWIIKECVDYLDKGILPSSISLSDRIDMIKKHINYLLLIKPLKVVVLEMRMHISKYLKGIKGSNNVNVLINKANSIDEIYDILDSFLKESSNV
ncbi:MAG: tRNA dihydrouridine synthase DusB [Bacilli bacterium]